MARKQAEPTPQARQFKHTAFNPIPMSTSDSPLLSICSIWQDQGWRLVQVIPHHQYESIAVFVCDDGAVES